MKRSNGRFLTTHMGGLPRPDDLGAMLTTRDAGESYDKDALANRVKSAVADVVKLQVENGIDIVNDGELSKFSWAAYFSDRLDGIERKAGTPRNPITARDMRLFPDWFGIAGSQGFSGVQRLAAYLRGETPVTAIGSRRAHVVGPLRYKGAVDTQIDIENLKAAARGLQVEELYLTGLGPGTAEYFVTNEYYKTDEELVFAIAEAMHEEFKAITDAGILLQIDEPAILTLWQTWPDMTVDEYRRWTRPRIEALNVALKGIPEDRVRVHICWGSAHHPHSQDIPLGQMIDLILQINAGAYSLEAANPQHDHDWQVWKEAKLPDGKILIPGVIGHFTDFVENPGLVADRYTKYANVVGAENVYGGTDCGIGTRVGAPSICWAKFRSMAEGARIASKQFWS
jgi:5-methyltetrahydropteroyltriglutamate--homocysteine methyltransferase